MVKTGVSGFILANEFDWGRKGVLVGWFGVGERDNGGDAETF